MRSDKRRKEQRKTKQGGFPLLAVVLILCAGIAVSAVILFIAKNKTSSSDMTSDKSSPNYEVVFLGKSGKVLSKESVKDGAPVFPPTLQENTTGNVFRGWDRDLISIQENIETRPIFQDISQETNALYINTYYTHGGEELSVNLWLAGKVDASEICLYLDFDDAVLSLVDFDGKADISKVEGGNYELSLSSDSNMSEGCCLSTMNFKVNDVTHIYTELVIKPKRIRKFFDGELQGTDATMVNGQINIY